MCFGYAIELLKKGWKIRRKSWKEKEYVALTTNATIYCDDNWPQLSACILRMTAEGACLWRPTEVELIVEDWEVYNEMEKGNTQKEE